MRILKALEEIHVTWTQFGKKRDKIAALLEDDQDMAYSAWRPVHALKYVMASQRLLRLEAWPCCHAMPHTIYNLGGDCVTISCDEVKVLKRWRQDLL
ncbi:hypothetical protein Tco_0090312 [Tanacetum coccineum]